MMITTWLLAVPFLQHSDGAGNGCEQRHVFLMFSMRLVGMMPG